MLTCVRYLSHALVLKMPVRYDHNQGTPTLANWIPGCSQQSRLPREVLEDCT